MAVKAHLHSNDSSHVSVHLPPGLINVASGGGLRIDSCAKLNVSSQRVGAAINGCLVDTHAGAGSGSAAFLWCEFAPTWTRSDSLRGLSFSHTDCPSHGRDSNWRASVADVCEK